MRISQRMYLALLPAVLGVFTVAALAYWGQYAHAVPQWIVAVASVATVASLVIAWINARYVARRVERLATTSSVQRSSDAATPRSPDELETIEGAVQDLSTAVGRAEAARQAEHSSLRDRQRSYAELLSLASRDALQRLDEIRLPLHILLENHFGDLNENQEEMLGSARAAAEQAGDAFQRLEEIADLDRGTLVMRRDRVRPADLVAGVLPALVAEGQQAGVHVTAEVAPALQSILGDRGRLQLALELLLHDSLRRTASGGEVRVTADVAGRDVLFAARHGDGAANPLATALGRRLIEAQGGSVSERDSGDGGRLTEIRLAR
jgi:signal transduction histidine kinase